MSQRKKEYRSDSKENYYKFISENKISETELPFKKWKENIQTCNWMYVEYALRTGMKSMLPFGFGPIAVNKKMYKRFKEYKDKDGNIKRVVNLKPNWQKSKELGKKVYHTNEHSDGYNFRWLWFYQDAKLLFSDLYVFRPGRYASRAIARYVKKDDDSRHNYLEWVKQ